MNYPVWLVTAFFKLSGRQRKNENPDYFEAHLEECRAVNRGDFILPRKWDFGKPVEEREVDGHTCYIINPGKERAVMYLHGGSFLHNMLKYHYRFIKRMCNDQDVTVYLPMYPMAPNYNYRDCYSMLEPLYDDIVNSHEKVTIMGDSAGGNISLALSEMVSRKPDSTILLSPFLDLVTEDERYEEYYKREPRLAMYELRRCAELWADGDDRRRPEISPLYGDLSGLHITLVVGTEEVLLLDAERLRDRAREEGIPMHYCEYEGMSHVFPVQPIKQADEVFPEIMEHMA